MRDSNEVPYIVVERDGGAGIGSFVLGALLGAGIALLLAPKSGEETQKDLRDGALRLRDAADEKMKEIQERLEVRLEQARSEIVERVDSIREAVESGRDAAREARTDLEERIDRSKAAYRAGIDAAREVAREEKEES